MTSDSSRQASITADFLDRYQRHEISGLPKYAQLREALLAAIDDGYWVPGNRVPNEATLAATTPYSLGTVQKAMHELVQSGVVIRRRGEGTFVAARGAPMNSPLHLRFETESGDPLPIYPHIVARERVETEGPWSTFFQQESATLLRIARVFLVGKLFHVSSDIYLDSARFPLFAEQPSRKLDPSNFKDVIRREYNVSVQRIQQFLRHVKLPSNICDALRISKGTFGNKLELYATGSGGRPIYYQEAFVPPNPCRLRLSDWTPGL